VSENSFSSNEIRAWLENETRSVLAPVHNQARQLRDEMSAALQNETEASRMLLDNSTKEIERRNMRVYNRARALNKLAHLFLDRLKKVNVPEQVSYDSLSKFVQDSQKVFLVADIDIKNWFPRISPFFIMDRRRFLTVHEKAKLTLSSLNDFLMKEYVKTKTLEETFKLIDELHTFENHLLEVESQGECLAKERFPLEKEIGELGQKVTDLESKGPIDKLKLVNAEIDSLSCEVKHSLRHLQKPFIKIQALSIQGGGSGLTPDELSKLGQYLETPFEAMSTEQDGCPVLKQILQKLVRLVDEGKLKLKPDKARKALQSADEILNRDSLASLQARCNEMSQRKQQLLDSTKLDEIKRNISVFQGQIEQLKARKTSIESHEAAKELEAVETRDKIRNHKHAIEKNVFGFLGKKVLIR
jgi:hypothetical protein